MGLQSLCKKQNIAISDEQIKEIFHDNNSAKLTKEQENRIADYGILGKAVLDAAYVAYWYITNQGMLAQNLEQNIEDNVEKKVREVYKNWRLSEDASTFQSSVKELDAICRFLGMVYCCYGFKKAYDCKCQ